MASHTLQGLTLLFILLRLSNAMFFYPNVQTSLLEHILIDTHGAYSSGFADAITPCSNYVSGAQTLGRETAAQWIRVAFHDFVTADVSAGTGGIDASIGFETLRAEDSGTAFNDSFSFFQPFVNAGVSMADLVAMSVVMSVGNCGGLEIPARGGRIDATEAGPFGVPAPETDLETTLSYFAGSGFNQADSIALTACGHTMGSVHHGGFPDVVPASAVTPNNTAGGIHLDTTPAVFDNDVVNEYVTWTGQQGGPLVNSFNETVRSDLRLYESDGNVTMENLASQGNAAFLNTCSSLFQRMIEIVPDTVTLSPVITPQTIKPVNATLDLTSSGTLTFSGSIRILTPTNTATATSLTLACSSKSTTLRTISGTGTSTFGTTTYFPFSIFNPPSCSSFTVSGANIPSQIFAVQSQGFIVPSLSSKIISRSNTVINVTAAASKNVNLAAGSYSVVVKAPIPQQGTLAPAIQSWTVTMTKEGKLGEYVLYTGSVNAGGAATGSVTAEILSNGAKVDIFML